MEAFKPKEVPLSSRIMKNWMFQAAVLIVAIATGLSFLRVQRDRDVEDFSDLARPLPQQTTLEAPPPPPPPPMEVAQPTTQAVVTPPPLTSNARPQAPPASGLIAPTPRARAVSTRATPTTRAANTRGGVANRDSVYTQIDLVYAEVPASVVANMEAGSRMIDAGAISAGVYPNIAPLMRQLATAQRVRGLRVLESARNLSVQINQPIITFKGTRDPAIGRNLGLTSQIIPTGMDENGLHFQIDIQRTFKQSGTTGVTESAYQAEISLTKGAGAFIYGLIPRGLDARERAAYANAGVLKVMASPDFQDGFSEFVLFIEAR